MDARKKAEEEPAATDTQLISSSSDGVPATATLDTVFDAASPAAEVPPIPNAPRRRLLVHAEEATLAGPGRWSVRCRSLTMLRRGKPVQFMHSGSLAESTMQHCEPCVCVCAIWERR